jgi:hypothetical protein
MSKTVILFLAIGTLSLNSCKRCKYCTEYQYGVAKGTEEYCGEELRYVDGDFDSVYNNGWKCVEK